MSQSGTVWAMLLPAFALLLLAGSLSAASVDQMNIKEVEEQVMPRARITSIPSSLTRFLFYGARPERQTGSGLPAGYKRSSSALDALTGVTLGKRSSPAEYLNLDPYFARQLPRFYTDFRWSPMDLYELSAGQIGADQAS